MILEDLLVSQKGRRVVYDLHWAPSPETVKELNEDFLTFRFGTNGRFSAIRGPQFMKDAERLIERIKKEPVG